MTDRNYIVTLSVDGHSEGHSFGSVDDAVAFVGQVTREALAQCEEKAISIGFDVDDGQMLSLDTEDPDGDEALDFLLASAGEDA
jgi:hypothetical protein